MLSSSPGPVKPSVSTADIDSMPGTVITSPPYRESRAPTGAKSTSSASRSSPRARPWVQATVATAVATTPPRPPTTR